MKTTRAIGLQNAEINLRNEEIQKLPGISTFLPDANRLKKPLNREEFYRQYPIINFYHVYWRKLLLMRIERISCVLIMAVFSFLAKAQSPSLPADSSRPRERIHLHTDKDMYLSGETIWFKAYVLSDGLPALTATNLYVNLLNERGAVLQKKMFPLSDASGDGSFTLPDSLDAANLLLAAYTTNTSDNELTYYKSIAVVSKKTQQAPGEPSVALQFLPEGGTFIANVPNHLAFKSDLSNGYPFEVRGVIKTAAGEVVDSFAAAHNGMGELVITPSANEKYTAEWRDDKNTLHQTALPVAANGVSVHTEQVNGFYYYVIQNPSPDENLREINIVVSQDDEKLYMATLDMSAIPVLSGKISLDKFHPGVARITVSGKNKEPLAERISFMQSDFRFGATVKLTENGAGKRAKNTIEIDIPDTLTSNLSLSVFDAKFGLRNNADIFSDLLLTNDIKGYVHEPGWYFAEPSAERKKGIDLVMLTNGWRRYNRQEISKQDNYITLSGTVTDTKKNLRANQSITLMLQGKDSSKHFYNVGTDKLGRFNKGGLIFYDSSIVWYQFNRKSGDPDMQLLMDKTGANAIAYKPGVIPAMPYPAASASAIVTGVPEAFVPQQTVDGFTEKGYKLGEVTVKSRKWRSNPMLLMDEKYATGIFRANATAFSFDLINDPLANKKGDLMTYLVGKVPGLTLEYPRGGKTGGFKNLMYSHGHNPTPVTYIFIDERQLLFDPQDGAALSELQGLNMDDIAYIKFFDRYPLQPDKPALAVYLKKGNEPDANSVSALPKTKVAGYSTVKEFYLPDYSVAENRRAALDKRTTLLWQPYLFTDRNNHKITVSFYNNDISTDLYLVLEGMNEAGKLVRVEKMLK